MAVDDGNGNCSSGSCTVIFTCIPKMKTIHLSDKSIKERLQFDDDDTDDSDDDDDDGIYVSDNKILV